MNTRGPRSSAACVTLLRALGIEASPALVSTEDEAAVAARLPSPNAFDHRKAARGIT